ncbi:hypothetical protein M569_01321, partial [Genlisea aurea]
MPSWLARTVSFCMRPLSRYVDMNEDESDDNIGGEDDPLLCSRDLENHSHGELSWAVVQANSILEDHSQVEAGRNATFVGVYDGHGGPEACDYVGDHLFQHLLGLTRETGMLSEDALRIAFSETEKGFQGLVRDAFPNAPLIAAVGSCCLVAVLWEDKLYVANLGDSRAVLGCGRADDAAAVVVAKQLTSDHNAAMDDVRKELEAMHPDDPQIVVSKKGVWRVKGIIQVSRSIGDAYLKSPEFALDESFPRFHLSEAVKEPVLRSDPATLSRELQMHDKFLIVASDGLWEHLTNQEAVDIVHNSPRKGVARRLVMRAMKKAAESRSVSYDVLKALDPGYRRLVHDDITAVVVFIDRHQDGKNSIHTSNNVAALIGPDLSVRHLSDFVGPS